MNEIESKAYMDAVRRQYEGVALSKDTMQEIASRSKKAGVSFNDFSDFYNERPSFDVSETDNRYFTEQSGAREAGPIEEIGLAFSGEQARSKAREQGIFSPSPKELAVKYAEGLIEAGVNAASMMNPITAEMTAAKVLSTAAKTSIYSTAGSVARSGLRDFTATTPVGNNEVAANAFDAFSSSVVEGFNTPWAKGTITKPIINGVGSAVFGLAQGAVSSNIRGEQGREAESRVFSTGGISGLTGVAGGMAKMADEAKVSIKTRNALIEAGISPDLIDLGLVNKQYASALRRSIDTDEIVKNRIISAYNQFSDALINKIGGFSDMTEPSTLTEQVSKRAGVIPTLEKGAVAASEATTAAKNALELAKKERRSIILESAGKKQKTINDQLMDKYNAEAQFAVDNFMAAFTPKQFSDAVGGASTSPLVAQQARSAIATQAEASYKAFKGVSDKLHDLIPDGDFNAASIVDRLNLSIDAAPQGVKDQVNSLLKNIPYQVGEKGERIYSNATRSQLINARNGIGDLIGLNGAPTADDHFLSKAVSSITDAMDEQKFDALGKKGAAAWDNAREYYRKIESFKNPDVRALVFGKNENTEFAQSLIKDIQTNGVGQGTRYSKLEQAFEASGNKQLSEMLKQRSRDAVRSYIMDMSTDLRGDVTPQRFLSALGEMRKRPDALQRFGFGNTRSLAFLEDAIASYPEASKLTQSQIDTIMSLPGAKGNLASLPALSQIKKSLAVQHAESKIGKAAIFEAIGDNSSARKAVYDARQAVSSAGLDERKANELLSIARNNPVASSFAMVNVDKGNYDQLYSTFFNASSGKSSNQDIRKMMIALDSGKREDKLLASALRTRFLNDALMQARNGRDPEKAISVFVEALKPSENPASLYQRASALFTKSQLNGIMKDYEAANVLSKFIDSPRVDLSVSQGLAAAGGTLASTATGISPKGSSASGAARNAVGLIARGKYALANSAYSIAPEAYMRTKDAVGSMAKFIDGLNFAQKAQFYMQNESVGRDLNEQKSPQ